MEGQCMREILYRAKRIDNGEWVEGYLIARKYSGTDTVFEAHIIIDAYVQLGVLNFGRRGGLVSECGHDCFKVDPKTICQYTGLTDKNGNKIWENDRVVKADEPEIFGTVEFGLYRGFYIVWRGSCAYRQDICYWANQIEAIGSIYDNQ